MLDVLTRGEARWLDSQCGVSSLPLHGATPLAPLRLER